MKLIGKNSVIFVLLRAKKVEKLREIAVCESELKAE